MCWLKNIRIGTLENIQRCIQKVYRNIWLGDRVAYTKLEMEKYTKSIQVRLSHRGEKVYKKVYGLVYKKREVNHLKWKDNLYTKKSVIRAANVYNKTGE